MPKLTLVIGNKNYSSWSLRPWLVLKQAGISFNEILIAIRKPDSGSKIERYSNAGRVPVLIDGKITVWESLAICEYLAEKFASKKIWPANRAARAAARAVSHEMHAGFTALRSAMPMNCRASIPQRGVSSQVAADIQRIQRIWKEMRKKFGKGGPFLFGRFSAADAMFAPVCLRFRTYDVKLDPVCRRYAAAVLELPGIREWVESARRETDVIPEMEVKSS